MNTKTVYAMDNITFSSKTATFTMLYGRNRQ